MAAGRGPAACTAATLATALHRGPIEGRPSATEGHRHDDSMLRRASGRSSTPRWRTIPRGGSTGAGATPSPTLFELEMKHIFEGNWIYLAHESQIPNNNDYLTIYMGRQPIVIARNKNGELNALINACSHRGAMLCRHKKDNKATYTCPFHGWTFNNAGKLLKVKDPRGAGYPETFNKDGSHDLTKVARFESYRGFLFGSLNPDVPPLEEHLGERGQDHRHDRRPVAGGPGGAARLLHLHLRRQLEAADRERRRRLPRQRRALELRRHHQPAQAPASRRPRPAPWTPAAGAKQGGGFYSFENGHLLLGPAGPTPRTGRCGAPRRARRRSTARPRRTG